MILSDEEMVEEGYALLEKELVPKGINIDSVKRKVSEFDVEVPSWVFGPFGGGSFSGYMALH